MSRTAWLTLAVVTAAVFMVSVEVTIISLALPQIREAFPDTSEAKLSWIITAYNLGVASLLLVSGWVADRYGRKRMFFGGLVVFLLGSLGAGLAQSADVVIACRALQSIGGAMQYPAGLALVLSAFPPARHQMAIGIWGAMGGLAAAVGPSLGALLVDGFGWRAVFLLNVPVAAVAVVFGPRWVQESTSDDTSGRVDLFSVPLASIGVGAAILGMTQGPEWGWTSGRILGSFALAFVLVAAFVVRSRTHATPLFDLALFRHRSYLLGNLGGVFFTVAFFGWLVPLPSYIQSVWGWSVLRTGFSIAPGPLLAMVVSVLGGRVATRLGNGLLLAVGGLCGAAGLAIQLASVGTTPSYIFGILIPGLLVGVAAGLGFAQLVAATMSDVPPNQYGMGGAGRTTVFQLAVAFAIALAFTIIARPNGPQQALDRYQITWAVSLACFIVQAVIFGGFLRRRQNVYST